MLLVFNSVSIYEYVILMYFNVFNVCVCDNIHTITRALEFWDYE